MFLIHQSPQLHQVNYQNVSLLAFINQKFLVTIPQCATAGKYPDPDSCYSYYECILVMSWYYAPELKTCPTGQAYDIYLKNCAPEATVDCQNRAKSTVIPQTTPATSVNSCTRAGLVCTTSQYFQECQSIGGQFSLVGEPMPCPTGQICSDLSGSAEWVF